MPLSDSCSVSGGRVSRASASPLGLAAPPGERGPFSSQTRPVKAQPLRFTSLTFGGTHCPPASRPPPWAGYAVMLAA